MFETCLSVVMPGLAPGIHVLLSIADEDVDGRDISALTRVFNALCPAMTDVGRFSTK
jgi:hypothetical protein